MKHRNPFLVLVLSIITLGIYDLYWLASTSKAMNARNTQRKAPSIWLLLSPIAIFILGIVATIMGHKSSGGSVIATLLFVITVIYGTIISFVWFWKYSKAVNEYTGGQMNFPMTFLLIWVLHFIGLVFIQDAFNDHLASAPAAPSPTPVASAPVMPVAPAQPQTNQPVVDVPVAAQPVVPHPETNSSVHIQPAPQPPLSPPTQDPPQA